MRYYVIHTYTNQQFSGNPAGVCILPHWINPKLMLKIAAENHFAETAFCVKVKDYYEIRWFDRGEELEISGHATLAAGFAIMNFVNKSIAEVKFKARKFELTVKQIDDLYHINFPVFKTQPYPISPELINILGIKPQQAYLGRDLVCVLKNEDEVINYQPDYEKLKLLPGYLFHITAPSTNKDRDIISRSFIPKKGKIEDYVCGSGHCHIIPIWQKKLKQDCFTAFQASARPGTLYCRIKDDWIDIAGQAAPFALGDIIL